ncbi:MAG: hypothetical protein IPL61_28180 [Myxococcales bacterium]|nr:hypothetical protein [Myxococcales bacterium]
MRSLVVCPLPWSIASLLALAVGCVDASDDAPPPDDPPCALVERVYQIDQVELPRTPSEAQAMALDLDDRGGVDNQLGLLHAAIVAVASSWDVGPAMTAHLAAGRLHWALVVGRCPTNGAATVELVRATDVDGNGALELGPRGQPATGVDVDRRVRSAHGIAQVPLGFLTDGGGGDATAAWQLGFALSTDLAREADGGLRGRLGFAIGPISDAALAPLAAYATGAMTDPVVGLVWTGQDTDRDGTISIAEIRVVVEALVAVDLDVGACDQLACYEPGGDDGRADHLSAGMRIHATPVDTE